MSLLRAKTTPGAEMLLKTHDVRHDSGHWQPARMMDQLVQYKEVVKSGCCPGLGLKKKMLKIKGPLEMLLKIKGTGKW